MEKDDIFIVAQSGLKFNQLDTDYYYYYHSSSLSLYFVNNCDFLHFSLCYFEWIIRKTAKILLYENSKWTRNQQMIHFFFSFELILHFSYISICFCLIWIRLLVFQAHSTSYFPFHFIFFVFRLFSFIRVSVSFRQSCSNYAKKKKHKKTENRSQIRTIHRSSSGIGSINRNNNKKIVLREALTLNHSKW